MLGPRHITFFQEVMVVNLISSTEAFPRVIRQERSRNKLFKSNFVRIGVYTVFRGLFDKVTR